MRNIPVPEPVEGGVSCTPKFLKRRNGDRGTKGLGDGRTLLELHSPEPVEGSKGLSFNYNFCPEGIKLNRIWYLMIFPFPGRGYTYQQMNLFP